MKMSRRTRPTLIAVTAATAVALLLGGCTGRQAATEPDEGAADDSPIVIGASWPQSGPLAAAAAGLHGFQAYIEATNAEGGIDGRQIELVTADDGYDPARLADNQRSFVEKDGAIAVVNFGGIAVPGRPYLNDKKVAQIALAGQTPLSDVENFPYTRAFWPDVAWEGELHAQWLKENAPDAVVGFIGFNNDLSESHIAGLEAGGVTPAQVATVPPGTADLSAQVSQFQAAGVNTVIINIGAPTIGAVTAYMDEIGYEPTLLLAGNMADFVTVVDPAGAEAVRDAYAFHWGKDPADPKNEEDEATQAFVAAMTEHGYEKDIRQALAFNGYGLGAALVEALKAAPELTADGLLEAWDSMEDTANPYLQDGMTLDAGFGGRLIFQVQLTQFDGTSWQPQGELIDLRELGIVE
ncbi:ABC transporter substrate-binding protein [Microbacterium lushaniae]|uniref:ABC transporter substrate-binding protein n=1 Tax=Microbacterium lushaniae TaxID=2614639 RepID=A0A5J6L5P4_9MICO|nr:ABC transporter substrate-binding protein [Microbacterium lushaniae]QEW03959.1 ABC transporter substrate-binding protein [Microbacterium lushaniae]